MCFFLNSYADLSVYYSLVLYTVSFPTWSTYYYNLVCDVSSQSCDLYAEIYGVHQSGNKHIKKLFYRETQSLQYFCWTCGYSLHLGYLAPASMRNNATVCVRVDCLCSCINTFHPRLQFASAWPVCLDDCKIFTAHLRYRTIHTKVCKTQVSFISLLNRSILVFFKIRYSYSISHIWKVC